MIKYVGTEIVPLTKHLAIDFATMPAWRGERPLSERRVTFLLRELESGCFYTPRWAVAKLGERTIRVNGQHSSTMLARLDPFPVGKVTMIDTYAVDSEVDLGGLFTKFDNPESTRKTREQLGALLPEELADLSPSAAERIAAGMYYGRTRFNAGAARGVHVLGGAVQSSPPFALWAQDILKGRVVGRTAVIASALLMWEADPNDCQLFWRRVTDEGDVNPNNPTRTLARTLRDDRGRGSVEEMKALCAKSVQAWNYWRRGQMIQKLSYRGNLPEAE